MCRSTSSRSPADARHVSNRCPDLCSTPAMPWREDCSMACRVPDEPSLPALNDGRAKRCNSSRARVAGYISAACADSCRFSASLRTRIDPRFSVLPRSVPFGLNVGATRNSVDFASKSRIACNVFRAEGRARARRACPICHAGRGPAVQERSPLQNSSPFRFVNGHQLNSVRHCQLSGYRLLRIQFVESRPFSARSDQIGSPAAEFCSRLRHSRSTFVRRMASTQCAPPRCAARTLSEPGSRRSRRMPRLKLLRAPESRPARRLAAATYPSRSIVQTNGRGFRNGVRP